MGILAPISFAFRSFNAISNAYFVAQIGWVIYKKLREWHKQKLSARELRMRFILEYTEERGSPPPEELVEIALKSYSAVENPVLEDIKRMIGIRR